MTNISDGELLAALHWEVCYIRGTQCLTHNRTARHGSLACEFQEQRIVAARAGITLAQQGQANPPKRHAADIFGLNEVANVYSEAIRQGRRPVVAVEQAFGLTKPTANRRIRLARDQGLLPPTGREAQS